MTPPLLVAFAEDHIIYRNSLVSYVETTADDIKFSILANNGRSLLEAINDASKLPDVCLLDINMPIMNGYETIVELKRNWPDIKVLAFSMHDNDFAVLNMLRRGAGGYIVKHSDPQEIVDGIRFIYKNSYFSTDLMERVVMNWYLMPEITEKEFEFLKYCCLDFHYNEIAKKMKVTIRTIEMYRNTLFKKLQVKTRPGLALFAMQMGLAPISTKQ